MDDIVEEEYYENQTHSPSILTNERLASQTEYTEHIEALNTKIDDLRNIIRGLAQELCETKPEYAKEKQIRLLERRKFENIEVKYRELMKKHQATID